MMAVRNEIREVLVKKQNETKNLELNYFLQEITHEL